MRAVIEQKNSKVAGQKTKIINFKKVTHWVDQRRTAKSADNSSRDLFYRTHCKLTHFWLILVHWPVQNHDCLLKQRATIYAHTPSHTLHPSWRPLHFLLVPIMQEQAALLPGSQAGEEGTPVWSHGAHGFPFTSTPPSLPLSIFTLLSLSFSFSPSLSFLCHWLFPSLSSPLSPFTSHTGSHCGSKRCIPPAGEGTHTNKHYVFSLEAGCSPDPKIFLHVTDMFWQSKKTKKTKQGFYIYGLCLSPGVEKGCGSWLKKKNSNVDKAQP